MGFTLVFPALLAFLSVLTPALTLPVAPNDYTQFCSLEGPSPYSGGNCNWGLGDHGSISCTCNRQPEDQLDLCHFYSSPSYEGYEYNGYGQYNTCYDFDYTFWNGVLGKTSSVSLGDDATSCWVYMQPGCAGPDTEVSSNVANLLDGAASFKCYGSRALPPSTYYGYSSPPSTYYGYSTPTPTATHTPSSSPVYILPATTSKSWSSNSGILSPPTPKSSAPIYDPHPPSPLSSSSKGGIIVTPTPPPTSLTPIYVPPPPPRSSSSSRSGIIVTPTPTPTTSTPIYGPTPPPPLSSSSRSGISVTPTPTLSTWTPANAPPSPSLSSSSKGGILVTPTPTPSTSIPVYAPSPPSPPPPFSSNSIGGIIITIPTPTLPTSIYIPSVSHPVTTQTPILPMPSTPIYSPLPLPPSSSSKGGIIVTPTLPTLPPPINYIPTPSTPVYILPL